MSDLDYLINKFELKWMGKEHAKKLINQKITTILKEDKEWNEKRGK